MPWFVLYTKSRNEKIVADKLQAQGINVYCPLIKVSRRWSDRVKTLEEPLFRSYCFVHLEEHERAQVFNVPGIVRYLFWQNKAAIVRDCEIDAIKGMLAEANHSQIKLKTIGPGSHITINSGSFQNISGNVVQQQGRTVTIVLTSMQLKLTINLSRANILE